MKPGTQNLTLSRTCDQLAIIGEKIERLPQDLTSIVPQAHEVDVLENIRENKNTDPLGSLKTMKASFAIDQDAEQLAVEFYLPSAYRFVATVSSAFVGNEKEPFEITGPRVCHPDHFEVRYDKLFLYYDQLRAGIRCDVSIEAIKSLT